MNEAPLAGGSGSERSRLRRRPDAIRHPTHEQFLARSSSTRNTGANTTPSRAARMGRGTTWFIRTGDSSFVLRHYRRGGLMAKFSKDAYLWSGENETRAFAEWYLTYHLHRAGPSGAHADRRALPAPRAVLPRRSHHPAHREQRAARRAAAQGSAVVHAVDRDRPLHPPLSRCRRVSRGPERAQHPADARAGVSHRLRSRRTAQTRLVGRHHAGAAVPLARKDHAAGRARTASPTRTGTRCWRAIANPRVCRRRPWPEAFPCASSTSASPI